MELRQLRYFITLANELSFTKAAQLLYISQPPLSYQIAQLEDELGTRLFERTSRTVSLTESGKALMPHAKAILDRTEEARSHLKRVAGGLCGRVQIGLAGSHFLGPFPKFITQWRQERADVEVLLHEMQPTDHMHALKDGRLDLSLSRQEVSGDGMRTSLLWKDPVVAALPLGHRLAGREKIRLKELEADEFVFLRLESSPFATRSHQACVRAGFAPRIVQQVVEIPAALNLVAAGLGVALVPASLARLRSDSVKICQLTHQQAKTEQSFNGDVYLHWRTIESSAVVTQFRMQLIEWAKKPANCLNKKAR